MNCPEVGSLLSIYYDGELPADKRIAVEVHVENCPRCAAELAELRRLSELAASLAEVTQPMPSTPSARRPQHGPAASAWFRAHQLRMVAGLTTAVVLLILIVGLSSLRAQHEHVDLAGYWKAMAVDPVQAHRQFVSRFDGHSVTADAAYHEVGFRPRVPDCPPDFVRVDSNYVLNMPCCRCIQSLCRREDGTLVVVFEHAKDQADWFPDQPQVVMQCAGTECRVLQLEDDLAASWRCGDRTLTIVGLRTMDELTQWVAWSSRSGVDNK